VIVQFKNKLVVYKKHPIWDVFLLFIFCLILGEQFRGLIFL